MIAKLWSNFYCETSAVVNFQPRGRNENGQDIGSFYVLDLMPPPHTGQVGATTTCSQNKHVGEFLYFKLPKPSVKVKSRSIKDVTKYVLNTDVQFTN